MALIGELELKVLNALKTIREGTIRDILREIIKSSEDDQFRGRNNIPAYTTVATVLTRLANKHQVQVREERFRKNQKRLVYLYEDVEKNVIDEMLYRIVEIFGEKSIVRLAERLEHFDQDQFDLLKEKVQKQLENEK